MSVLHPKAFQYPVDCGRYQPKGENMNPDEQIAQYKKDIVALQENLAKLEQEKAKEILQPGDVKEILQPGDVVEYEWGGEHFFGRSLRFIVEDSRGNIFAVSPKTGKFILCQNEFMVYRYKKVGRINDFIRDQL